MEYKKGQKLEELPNCVNCGHKVPDNFNVLTDTENNDFPCCNMECINQLHKRMTGKFPKWEKVNSLTDK